MKIDLAWSEDWIGIYIDGELIQEGHSVNFYDFIMELKHRGIVKSYRSFEAEIEDSLPEKLEDVVIID